jgi:selenocysteine lyase/cysteine desulfurase
MAGLEAAMDFFEKVGGENIRKRHHFLASYVRDRVSRIPKTSFMNGPPPDLATAMVKVALPMQRFDKGEKIWKEHKIWFNVAQGNDTTPASVRFSCPYYILPKHIDRAIEVLRRELAG